MKLIIRNSVSVLLALLVLVTTSGFTVYKHHCNAENTSQLSFMIEDFDCDHIDHEHEHFLPSCCSENHETEDAACNEGNCCNTERIVVKLNITLDTQKVLKQVAPDHFADLILAEDIIEYPASENEHIIISNDLPPPISGKALHIFLQQLNIDCLTV